jgi:DNA-binding NarL/FixJ family response regulator
MPGLNQRQSRQLLDILEKLYATQTLPEFTSSLLTSIGEVIPSVGVTYNELDLARRRSYDVFLPVPPRLHEVAPLWSKHMKEQPVMAHFMKHRDRRPLAISDFISQRQMHNLGMYSEVFRQLKTEDALCIALEVKGSAIIGMGVGRDRRGFCDRERTAFSLLRPHIAQAWRNVRALTDMRERMQAMSATLAELGVGIVDLDGGKRLRFVSPQAQALIARHLSGLPRLTRAQLIEKLNSWIRGTLKRDTETEVLPPRAPLILESGHGRLIIQPYGDPPGSRFLLREEPRPISPGALRGLGLTERESEVLAWIVEGKTNAEIAVILKASPHTVKRHVEAILSRLGVETRTAAAIVALQAARLVLQAR